MDDRMAFMWERKGNKSSLTEFKWKGGGTIAN